MKAKTLFFLIALFILVMFTAACEPENPPVDDTPEIVATATANPTSESAILPTSQPSDTAQPATLPPGIPPTATLAPTSEATALPTETLAATSVPTLEPTSTLAPGITPTVTPYTPPTATPPPPTATAIPPTPLPGISLQVLNSTNYMDTNGDFHVIGEVKNIGSSTLTNMELTVVIKNASGVSLLTDSNNQTVPSLNFNPMLTNLAPGDTSPFGFTLYAGSGTPDPGSVSVTPSSQDVSDVSLATVEIQHARMVVNGSGSFLISGSVINKSDQPVLIRDLAATLINTDKKILATAYSVDYSVFLQPAGDPNKLDSTPFYLRIDSPASQPADWRIYVDAEETTPPTSSDLKATITNHFTDGSGVFHLIGTINNTSNDTLTTKLVAALYDKNNSVLDAYATGSPVNIGPGEVIPFDISSFENVNNSADIAGTLDHYTVQIDNYHTFTPVIDFVTLTTTIDSTQKNANDWVVAGKLTNNSNKSLNLETVLVGIYNGSGVLMAVDYGWILPTGDSIDPGAVNNYSVDVPIAPGTNTTNFTVKILAKGEIK